VVHALSTRGFDRVGRRAWLDHRFSKLTLDDGARQRLREVEEEHNQEQAWIDGIISAASGDHIRPREPTNPWRQLTILHAEIVKSAMRFKGALSRYHVQEEWTEAMRDEGFGGRAAALEELRGVGLTVPTIARLYLLWKVDGHFVSTKEERSTGIDRIEERFKKTLQRNPIGRPHRRTRARKVKGR
jgi:hypothetical protein